MRPEDACHKIIVTSNNACSSEKIVVVPIHRLQEAITECLEEPLHRLLEKWEENLKEISPINQRNRILSEIVIIRKQMMFEENKEEPEANASLANATIVPSIVKEYLFRLFFFNFQYFNTVNYLSTVISSYFITITRV